MPRKNLTNKQIRESNALELVLRMNALHAISESRPEDAAVPISDIWEAQAIDKELRCKLKRLLVFAKEED